MQILYCERFVEFMIDLLAQLPTRRFFRAVVIDQHVVVRAQLSPLYKLSANSRVPSGGQAGGGGKLFSQLLEMLKFYVGFEIDDRTGNALSDSKLLDAHYSKFQRMQYVAFKYFPKELKSLSLASIASIDTRDTLSAQLSALSNIRLLEFCERLQLLSPPQGFTTPVAVALAPAMGGSAAKAVVEAKSLFEKRQAERDAQVAAAVLASDGAAAAAAEAEAAQAAHYPELYQNREFLYELIINSYERRLSQRQSVKNMSLYPPEVPLACSPPQVHITVTLIFFVCVCADHTHTHTPHITGHSV